MTAATRVGNAATLPQLLVERALREPRRIALRAKNLGIWQTLDWGSYLDRVQHLSLGLRALGLSAGDRVAIIGDNHPEWLIAELAVQSAGALSIGLYQDAAAEELQFLVEFSGTRIVVAEDQEQVDKFLEVRARLPRLEHVVYWDPRGLSGYPPDGLRPLAEVMDLGARADQAPFAQTVAAGKGSDAALLSTTSGTTGKPKLAVLRHDNMLAMARALLATEPIHQGYEFLSFLPLAWIGEQMISVACGLSAGFTVNFPEEPETVQENLQEIGPHMMFAPPRIWENLVSEVQVKGEDTAAWKRRVLDWALAVGHRHADLRLGHRPVPAALRVSRALAEASCLFWLKDRLGLRRLERAYTGGAALGPDTFRFFHALGVNLKQIYGQTEVAGISCVHRDGDVRFSTVGTPLPGSDVRIADDGEILTRSDAVFAGYHENPEATAQALRDGYLHSGDAGYFDSHDHLVVIDRASDVMTLADGTRFSPQFIENKLKFSPYVKEAVVFGGDWPMVTAIVVIDYQNTGKWAERRQLPYTTFTDLAQKEEISDLVAAHVGRINEDLPAAARVRRFLLLHKELDADDAELTRTRKVRRGFVAERYRQLLDALYAGSAAVRVRTEITYQDGRTATLDTELRITDVPAGP